MNKYTQYHKCPSTTVRKWYTASMVPWKNIKVPGGRLWLNTGNTALIIRTAHLESQLAWKSMTTMASSRNWPTILKQKSDSGDKKMSLKF